jgi:hypothetical protein
LVWALVVLSRVACVHRSAHRLLSDGDEARDMIENNLSPSIAIDRLLLPTTGRDRSASFAIDQKGLPIHPKDLSPSIVVYRDLHGYMIKSIMMASAAHRASLAQPAGDLVRAEDMWSACKI